MSGQQVAQRVAPRFRLNGASYKASKEVEYVRHRGYEPNILILDDYTVCGRDEGRWICIDSGDGYVVSSDSVVGVLYAHFGGHVKKVVEQADKIVVYKDDGEVVELSDVL
jgi:hypothetical protein